MIICMSNPVKSPWRPEDTIANRFRLVRAPLGISQRELGEKVGVPAHQIQSIEDGKAGRHIDQKVAKIAKVLGVDREWLMFGGSLDDGESAAASDESGKVTAG